MLEISNLIQTLSTRLNLSTNAQLKAATYRRLLMMSSVTFVLHHGQHYGKLNGVQLGDYHDIIFLQSNNAHDTDFLKAFLIPLR